MVRSIIIMRTKSLRQADNTGLLFANGGRGPGRPDSAVPRGGNPAPAMAAGLPPQTSEVTKVPALDRKRGRQAGVGSGSRTGRWKTELGWLGSSGQGLAEQDACCSGIVPMYC